jgi:hypothetical protein
MGGTIEDYKLKISKLSDEALEKKLLQINEEKHKERYELIKNEMLTRNKILEPETNNKKQSKPRITFLLITGLYFILIGGGHLIELLITPVSLFSEYNVSILPFIYIFLFIVFITGALLFSSGIMMKNYRLKSLFLLIGIIGVFLFSILRILFLLFFEKLFADGGFIWGFIHNFLLIRQNTTGTEAGIVGYKIGQYFGTCIWIIIAFYLIGYYKNIKSYYHQITLKFSKKK